MGCDDENTQCPQYNGLRVWGWDEGFQAQLGPGESLARVAAVDRESLLLVDDTGSFRARVAGSYMHRHALSYQLPCVGDWVRVDKQPGGDIGVIHGILERRTSLRRKSAGNDIDWQMIAANVDTVMIVQSCHTDFNLKRLERYLVMVMEGGAEAVILLTKTDLVAPDVLAGQIDDIRAAGITAQVLSISNVSGHGVATLMDQLLPGKTYCFVGSSGVGKSTLINRLVGRAVQETKTVSETGEGRHTTVRRELIRLEGGALVIDNPGMREFGVFGAEDGITLSFSDITDLAEHCRYRDCSHRDEPGCAVIEAVNAGEINRDHVENYLKLKVESEFNQMSYAKKRKKDRDVGRVIKSAKKTFKRSTD
jgi:ribosome biogenesis GTPase